MHLLHALQKFATTIEIPHTQILLRGVFNGAQEIVITSVLFLLLTLTTTFLAAWYWLSSEPVSPAAVVQDTQQTTDFKLQNHQGESVAPEDFRGQWLLVFFGFTHYPDVCPTSLGTLSGVINSLGSSAAQVQPLMITIDPERDTAEVLAEYVSYFHPSIIGLTGTSRQIDDAVASFRAHYARAPSGADNSDGLAHSSFLYLISPDQAFAALYPHDNAAESIATDIRTRLEANE